MLTPSSRAECAPPSAASIPPQHSQLLGFLNFGKGVGNVLSGPVSGALRGKSTIDVGDHGVGRSKSVILFTGSCMDGAERCGCGVVVSEVAER